MDTYFLFTPTAWIESLQQSKLGRLFNFNDNELLTTDDGDDSSDNNNNNNHVKKKQENNGIKKEVYKITEMPDYLRFNPWILSGYRAPGLSTKESFCSLSYLHNETINIFTHALPILIVVANFESMFGSLPQCWFTWFHAVSCLTPWCGSFAYHVFMNHRNGEAFYHKLLCIDMSGIWFTQTFGALTTISVSFAQFSNEIRITIIVFYLLVSLYALYKGVTATNTWQRMFSFLVLVLIRAIGFTVRQSMTDRPLAGLHLVHVLNQEILPIFGAIISAARLPERFFPGKFDLFLNSHNIMHCLVVAGGIHMHLAFRQEIELAKFYKHF